jgi:hypothetical protein
LWNKKDLKKTDLVPVEYESNYTKGEISEDEYKYWKDTYPQEVAINTKSKK